MNRKMSIMLDVMQDFVFHVSVSEWVLLLCRVLSSRRENEKGFRVLKILNGILCGNLMRK